MLGEYPLLRDSQQAHLAHDFSPKHQLFSNVRARAGLIILAACIPFVCCLSNPWIWDDGLLLGQRLADQKNVSLVDVWRQPYWGDVGPADTYRPLSLSLILLETRMFHDSVASYHLVSLALHAAVSLLVMAVVGRLAGKAIGWGTALLFAIHPVHAEAVAMVYGQLELICALFVLATVWLYVYSRRDCLRPLAFAAALLCSFAAACSKESGLMLPPLLMLVRATCLSGTGDATSRLKEFTRGLGWDLLFLLPLGLYLLLRYQALGGLAPAPEATVTLGYTLGMRIKTIVVSLSHAVRLCTFPTGQGLYYGHLRDAVFGRPYSEVLWLVAAILAFARLASGIGRRRALFGAGWFLLAFLPVSNLIPTGVLVAERTLYLPSLGVCFLVASLLVGLARSEFSSGIIRSILTIVVLLCIVGSNVLVSHWCDVETLWRSTVSAHPRSPMAHFELGKAILNRWDRTKIEPLPLDFEEASNAFDTAFRLNPQNVAALVAGSVVAFKRGDRAEAERLLRQAVATDPADQAALSALQKFLAETSSGASARE